MQKRHFELLAKAFAEAGPEATKAELLKKMVEALKPTNPLFNAERFIEAANK
jgi:hypothetical protein